MYREICRYFWKNINLLMICSYLIFPFPIVIIHFLLLFGKKKKLIFFFVVDLSVKVQEHSYSMRTLHLHS